MKELNEAQISFFNDALRKMNEISDGYQQGRIKHFDYAAKLDAVIDATGLERDVFYREIANKKHKLNTGMLREPPPSPKYDAPIKKPARVRKTRA